MAWIMDTISMHRGYTEAGTVTGKPVSVGGTLGRAEATGRGLLYIVQEAAKRYGMSLEGSTVAVQGFGKVGAIAAQLLHRAGARVVAVSDSSGAIYGERGLDCETLMPYREDRIPLAQASQGDKITNRELLSLPVDFLIPAALEGQIHAGNAGEVRARYVVEGANGPDHARSGCDPVGEGCRSYPRYPGERGRRDRLCISNGCRTSSSTSGKKRKSTSGCIAFLRVPAGTFRDGGAAQHQPARGGHDAGGEPGRGGDADSRDLSVGVRSKELGAGSLE